MKGGRKRWVMIAKVVIGLVVLVGLGLAIKNALVQWSEHSQGLTDRVGELSQQIESESNDDRRAELVAERDEVRKAIPSLGNLNWWLILLASGCYAIGLLPPALVLKHAIATFGQEASWGRIVSAQLLGHLGKYVPGKAMVVILRVGVLKSAGVATWPATVSVFMETLLMMAVGGAIAGALVCFLPVPAWILFAAAGVAVTASLPTLPPVLRRVATKLAPRRPHDARLVTALDHEGGGDVNVPIVGAGSFFVFGWFWSAFSWLWIGLSFTMLVAAIPSLNELPSWGNLFVASTAAIALAVVIGFASLLPGGAGVRELVLTTLLAPSVGPAHALLAAVAARILFIAVEVACAGIVWRMERPNAARDTVQSPG